MRVTSHDVARRAGVSQPTVSRALRDQRGVSIATRQKVREAAAALGYVPIQSGRALSTQRTRRIGIVSDELTNPFYPALIAPLHDHLSRADYRTILLTDTRDGFDLEPVLDGSLDGVVLTSCRLGSSVPSELRSRGIPFVMVNRENHDVAVDACVPDNVGGAVQVADLLIDAGHRRVGVISGPHDTSTGHERATAFRDQLARRGVALHPDLQRHVEFSVADGTAAADEVLAAGDVTALFCANDMLALGALNAARSRGLAVPADLSVVGFDDVALAGYPAIGLTTVRVDHEQLARRAVDLLVRRIDDPSAPVVREVVAARVVLRATHGAPR